MTAEKVVGAKYMVISGDYQTGAEVGDIVTLVFDDGTTAPRFSLKNGASTFIRMRDVILIGNHDSKLRIYDLVAGTVYKDDEGDLTMRTAVPVGGKTVFLLRPSFTGGYFISELFSEEDLDTETYTVATEDERELFLKEFAAFVAEDAGEEEETEEAEEPAASYKVGDIVEITGNTSPYHYLDIGELVTVADVDAERKTLIVTGSLSQRVCFADVNPANQQHISKEQFAAIKVGDKLKLRTDLTVGEDYGACGWVTSMQKLADKGVTPVVEMVAGASYARATAENDLWLYSAEMIAEVIPAEEEFNCPELVAGEVYYMESGFKWVFRYYPCASNYADITYVGGPHVPAHPWGSLYTNPTGLRIDKEYRKATPEEVAMLEAAEKEAGYVPPLVNAVGTVIEAGKYYKIKSSSATEYICKVVEVYEGSFLKAGLLVELDGTPTDTKTPPTTAIGSVYGVYAVPATEEQIALYEAVLALRTAQQTFEEATQAVKEAA